MSNLINMGISPEIFSKNLISKTIYPMEIVVLGIIDEWMGWKSLRLL